jgi:hypothetical protein
MVTWHVQPIDPNLLGLDGQQSYRILCKASRILMKRRMVKLLNMIACVLIVLPFTGVAQIVWKKSEGTKTITKPSYADWTQEANQDRITDSVWITRANSQRIFNIRKENASATTSPFGTEWAFGTTDSFTTLTYKTFTTLSGNDPQSLIGKNLVLHLTAENVYIDFKFLSYAGGNTGGGFSYIRADGILPVELTSFTAAATGSTVRLMWSTATEVNNHGFEIEKLSNSRIITLQNSAWEKIGFVEGNGTTNAPKEYLFSDNNLIAGKYSYRLKQIDRDGSFTYSPSVEVIINGAPTAFALEQNYPNPFNPSTTIGFTLSPNPSPSGRGEGVRVTLKVYNAVGQEVATLVNNELLEAGVYHQKQFNASHLASGIYFARLTSGGKTMLKKMMLIK